jgi:DNA-binding transcriptional LysR family regulator
VQRYDRGESGELSVGMTSSASLHQLVPAILRRFHDAYPFAEVSVQESETYELIVALRDGSIDIALFHIPIDRFPDLSARVLAEVELMVAAPRNHPLALAGAPVTLEAILDEPLVVYRRREGVGIFDSIFRIFAATGATPQIAGEVTRLIAAINLVAAGRGLTLVPAPMQTLHPESVVYLPLSPNPFPPLPLSLAYRRDVRVALVRNFLEQTVDLTAR